MAAEMEVDGRQMTPVWREGNKNFATKHYYGALQSKIILEGNLGKLQNQNYTGMEGEQKISNKIIIMECKNEILANFVTKMTPVWRESKINCSENKFYDKNIIMEGKNETWGTLEPK